MSLDILSWTEAYLKYKDTVQRRILKLNKYEDKQELLCELKDGTIHKYLCVDSLANLSPKDLKGLRVSILNTKKNMTWLLDNWQEVKDYDTVFIFANPKKATHWSITPRLHNNIVEKSAIKPGIKALFDSIPEV